jgi:hypothetical protein|tara:strand:+ start:241 stop:354 length:114 start_codon:yes stop_codon:yes gene_type:complete
MELESEDQQLEKLNFTSVAGQVKYHNMMLLKKPYTIW